MRLPTALSLHFNVFIYRNTVVKSTRNKHHCALQANAEDGLESPFVCAVHAHLDYGKVGIKHYWHTMEMMYASLQ